jgi:hypothetical protein
LKPGKGVEILFQVQWDTLEDFQERMPEQMGILKEPFLLRAEQINGLGSGLPKRKLGDLLGSCCGSPGSMGDDVG